jgi:hypothetical protein
MSVKKLFSVEAVVARHLKMGKQYENLETDVLREIRSLERTSESVWPAFSYYDHEYAVEQTLRPDGTKGNPNAYDRYLISLIASRIGKNFPLDITPPDSPSYTGEQEKSKGREHTFCRDAETTVRYDPWPETKTKIADGVSVDWLALYKISCKIADDLCRNPESPVHYHNDFHELVQEAWFAIQFKAIPRYDNRGDAEFTTFAYRVIKNHLLDFIRWPVDPVEDGDKVRTRTGRDIGTSDFDFDAIPWGQPRVTKSPHRHSEEWSAPDL